MTTLCWFPLADKTALTLRAWTPLDPEGVLWYLADHLSPADGGSMDGICLSSTSHRCSMGLRSGEFGAKSTSHTRTRPPSSIAPWSSSDAGVPIVRAFGGAQGSAILTPFYQNQQQQLVGWMDARGRLCSPCAPMTLFHHWIGKCSFFGPLLIVTAADREHPTRAQVLEMLLPSRLDITIKPGTPVYPINIKNMLG